MAQQVQDQRADSPLMDATNKGCTTPRVDPEAKDCFTTPRRQRGRMLTPPPAPRPRRRYSLGGSSSPPPAPHQAARKSALFLEIERDSVPQVCQELLHRGSGISSLDNPGCEPALCCAVRAGANPEMFRLLLRHGADVNEENQFGHTALDMLCGLNPPPPLNLSSRRPGPGDLMSFDTDLRSWAAEIMPGDFLSSWAMTDRWRLGFHSSFGMDDAEVNTSAHPQCLSPSTWHPLGASNRGALASADKSREREERLVEAAKVLLAAGAHVRREALADGDSHHQPHRFPRLVQLVQSYAAVSAYRIVGQEVVRGAAGTHGTHLGQTLGDDLLLRQICSFLAPEGYCFWAIEPR